MTELKGLVSGSQLADRVDLSPPPKMDALGLKRGPVCSPLAEGVVLAAEAPEGPEAHEDGGQTVGVRDGVLGGARTRGGRDRVIILNNYSHNNGRALG